MLTVTAGVKCSGVRSPAFYLLSPQFVRLKSIKSWAKKQIK